MASPNTVFVKNIEAKTDDKEIKDFFSFCGKITSVDVSKEGETKSATVTFEKTAAARTALLLNNTQLGANQIQVTGSGHEEASHDTGATELEGNEIPQEQKPRARVLAEYMAHGYVVGDAALAKALDLDRQHGVSKRFFDALTALDHKLHATDRAKAADQSYGVTQKAGGALVSLNSFFEKATSSQTGRKIVGFYDNAQKTVLDIHNESRRLADLKKEEHGGDAAKAAGLEKVLGVEKKPADASASAPGVTPSTTGSTTTEKFDPPPTA